MFLLIPMITLMSILMITLRLMIMLAKLPSKKHMDLEPMLEEFWTILASFLETFWGPGGSPGAGSAGRRWFIDFRQFLEASWGPSWGPCCPKVGLQDFLKFIFSWFLPFEKASRFHKLFDIALGPSWDRLGTVLGSILRGFWGPKSMSTTT